MKKEEAGAAYERDEWYGRIKRNRMRRSAKNEATDEAESDAGGSNLSAEAYEDAQEQCEGGRAEAEGEGAFRRPSSFLRTSPTKIGSPETAHNCSFAIRDRSGPARVGGATVEGGRQAPGLAVKADAGAG